jgi:hypothetical protein
VRALAFIGIAYGLLLLWGVLGQFSPVTLAAPDLALLVPLYLGLTDEGHVIPALGCSVCVGYLACALGGAPHGLFETCASAACLFGHTLARRFFVRGVLVVAIVGAATSVLSSAVILLAQAEALRAHSFAELVWVALAEAGLTALGAPACFVLFRWVDARRDARRLQRREEGAFS